MKYYKLSEELGLRILNYLGNKAYKRVVELIQAIQTLPPIEMEPESEEEEALKK